MLHINFLPLEFSAPRAPITEQLPLPFMDGHQPVHVQYRFLPNSPKAALRASSSRLRRDILTAALRASECTTNTSPDLTANAIRYREILQFFSAVWTMESGVSHG